MEDDLTRCIDLFPNLLRRNGLAVCRHKLKPLQVNKFARHAGEVHSFVAEIP